MESKVEPSAFHIIVLCCSSLTGVLQASRAGRGLSQRQIERRSIHHPHRSFFVLLSRALLTSLLQSTLTEINKGFDMMHSGDCIRCVVDMTK